MNVKKHRNDRSNGIMALRGERGEMNIGMILLVLGLLGMIAVLAIKFTSTGPDDEFMGIVNPEGVYGEYFMSGMVVGLVVLVIGAVLSRKKEAEPLFDEEEEEVMDLEEEEEGICPTCGAIIAVTCVECPECGEELEPPEGEIGDEPGVTMECPICGGVLSPQDTECTECGEPVAETEEKDDDDLFADLDDL